MGQSQDCSGQCLCTCALAQATWCQFDNVSYCTASAHMAAEAGTTPAQILIDLPFPAYTVIRSLHNKLFAVLLGQEVADHTQLWEILQISDAQTDTSYNELSPSGVASTQGGDSGMYHYC